MDKRELIAALSKFKKRVGKRFGVKKIILFGSRANKDYKHDSDVDLIIVGNFKEKSNLARAPKLYLQWDIDLPVDILCFTEEEFERLGKRVSIVSEALKNGIVVK